MLKRTLSILISIILLFSIFTGCSASSQKSDSATSQRLMNKSASNEVAANKGYGNDRGEVAYDADANVNYDINSKGVEKEDIKKIIKNGEISVEVKDVDASYTGIMEIVNSVGGEEFNKNYTISGEYKRMELVLKIPPEKLNLFQDKITEYVGAGKVRNINIRSTDITSEYYDYTARLNSYKTSRDQMIELMKKAQNIDETLRIQAEITRLQADIDSMQGQINMWDKLINMSTITLYIDQEDNPFKTSTKVSWKFNSFNEIWTTMRNGFVNVINTMYSLIIWLVIAIVSLSPVILIIGVALYIAFYVKRKRKDKNISN